MSHTFLNYLITINEHKSLNKHKLTSTCVEKHTWNHICLSFWRPLYGQGCHSTARTADTVCSLICADSFHHSPVFVFLLQLCRQRGAYRFIITSTWALLSLSGHCSPPSCSLAKINSENLDPLEWERSRCYSANQRCRSLDGALLKCYFST